MRDVEDTSALTAFVVNALRRHVALILVLCVLGGVAGATFALRQGIHYTANASILVNPLQGNPYAPDGRGEQLVNLETEAQLIRTDGVAQLAAKQMRTSTPADELRAAIEIENPTNTQVLRISFTAADSRDALRGAQAFADSYLTYRRQRAQSVIDARLARIRQQQTSTQSSLNDATAELARTSTEAARRAYLGERVSALASQLASLETEVSTLTATDLSPGQVISPAALPIGVGGNYTPLMFGGAGLLGGLLLGAALALLRTRLDQRMHDPNDVEKLGVRLLGFVDAGGRLGGRRSSADPPLLPEAYRAIRTTIITSTDVPPVTLAVASVRSGIASGPEAAGMAVGLARAGFSVALVDATGEVTRLLTGTGALPGLSELLAGITGLRNMLVQPEDNLVLLPLGRPARETMDQLLSGQMRATLGRLREWYDYVILAAPPAPSADGQALASLANGVVLVGALGVSSRADLATATAALEHVNAMPLGAVMVAGLSLAGTAPRRSLLGRLLMPLARRQARRRAQKEARELGKGASRFPEPTLAAESADRVPHARPAVRQGGEAHTPINGTRRRRITPSHPTRATARAIAANGTSRSHETGHLEATVGTDDFEGQRPDRGDD